MPTLFVFGLGYTAGVLAHGLRRQGWRVLGTGSAGGLAFDDSAGVAAALAGATHILSSVPPSPAGGDPVLAAYGEAIAAAPAGWVGYLSSTGVYGDTAGAWVDESAPTGGGRRSARVEADTAWQALDGPERGPQSGNKSGPRDRRVRLFRLPGIYGPGRSALDRVRQGKAHRIDLPGQVFSRVHVADIAAAIEASFAGPPGVYNLADDLPAGQNAVVEEACRLLGFAPPPLRPLGEAGLSPAALGFYGENRRVASGRARRLLGWRPRHPTFAEGLRAILREERGADCGRR